MRKSLTLTERQWRRLEKIAVETDSKATAGPTVGDSSWRALIRRIAEGKLAVKKVGLFKNEREAVQMIDEGTKVETRNEPGKPTGSVTAGWSFLNGFFCGDKKGLENAEEVVRTMVEHRPLEEWHAVHD